MPFEPQNPEERMRASELLALLGDLDRDDLQVHLRKLEFMLKHGTALTASEVELLKVSKLDCELLIQFTNALHERQISMEDRCVLLAAVDREQEERRRARSN